MSRGVIITAHNNAEIDYINIAYINALMVRKNLKVPVTLVTDSGTLSWAKTSIGEDNLNNCFDNIIEVDRNYTFDNLRNFSDTSYSTKSLQFYNCRHWMIYELSPYDETLFIDCDYLIMSSALSNCWGSNNDVMINSLIYSPVEQNIYHKNMDQLGIRLYWATVIYFRKSVTAKHLFSIVRHVEENYLYYRDLYCFANGMFRNDYAFSIAVHTLNGFSDSGLLINELPIPGLLMSWDTHDIYDINNLNEITLYAEKKEAKGEYILVRLKNTDVHIMNKWSINRHATKLISLYKGDLCLADI